MKKLGFSVALLMLVLLLASCGGATPAATPAPAPAPAPTPTPAPAPTPPAPAAIDAAKLYTTNCAVCHGPNRQGITGLGLPLTPTAVAAKSDDELKNTITNGKANTAMAGFTGRLSAAEIDALVKFIKNTPP